MKLYNSLTRQTEEFVPLKKGFVGLYTCGPTVYDFAHIGNFRTYMTADFLLRLLKYDGIVVKYVMNITDVGHLTGDNLGDADTGEDRMEQSAKKEDKTAYEIAEFYTRQFLEDLVNLGLMRPDIICKATDHIVEQIALVQKLEEKGFAYKISDGIYFDTRKFPRYGELSTLREINEGARVEINPQKRNPRDFALWKFSPKGEKRQMEWESPWGIGFPGWHIECSAMAMKYLGETFDIHVGGEDLRSTHHPNEMAQSEAATGKTFVKYWVHGAFLLVDGGRMSKSLNNNYTLTDIVGKGFSPTALRYLYLTAHYKSPLNFTWSSLAGAQTALEKLYGFVRASHSPQFVTRKVLSKEKLKKIDAYKTKFLESLNNDLNFPQGLAVLWEMLKSNISDFDKLETLLDWDQILGLGLADAGQDEEVPEDIKKLGADRESLRKAGKFVEADEVRMQIEAMGWEVLDTPVGAKFKKSALWTSKK